MENNVNIVKFMIIKGYMCSNYTPKPIKNLYKKDPSIQYDEPQRLYLNLPKS